jgi:hypothetical protein
MPDTGSRHSFVPWKASEQDADRFATKIPIYLFYSIILCKFAAVLIIKI